MTRFKVGDRVLVDFFEDDSHWLEGIIVGKLLETWIISVKFKILDHTLYCNRNRMRKYR